MHWTRRQFIQLTGAAAAALGLGSFSLSSANAHASFDDWRALPGTKIRLTLDIDQPAKKRVHLVAQTENEQRILATLDGAQTLDIVVPHVKTNEESFLLFAVVTDNGAPACISDPLEVLAEPFRFGL